MASKARNEILLMPIDETETVHSILDKTKNDSSYKEQVYKFGKKIIRVKVFVRFN